MKLYDREQMQFMASCDLGRNWDLMASGPTLFLIGADGKPQWPNNNNNKEDLAERVAAC